jgi:hypothetical protein
MKLHSSEALYSGDFHPENTSRKPHCSESLLVFTVEKIDLKQTSREIKLKKNF